MAFGICFLLVSAVHLYHSYLDDAKKRAYTKPLLLLFLTLFYVSAAKAILPALVLALICSWIGDVLLMKPGTFWFAIGGISFGFAHLFFILTYVPHIVWGEVPLRIVVCGIVVYATVTMLVIRDLQKIVPQRLWVPMCAYLIANGTMNVFALMQLLSLKNTGALIAFIGAALFFASDCTLYYVRYHPDKNKIFKRHFTVMSAYLAGEGMIVLGTLLLSNG